MKKNICVFISNRANYSSIKCVLQKIKIKLTYSRRYKNTFSILFLKSINNLSIEVFY